jgi:4-carboxymuconolactone decarboxylase
MKELNPQQKFSVLVSAALVTRKGDQPASEFRAALQEGLTPEEIAELILQSLLFDGYPTALEGFLTLQALIPGRLPAESLSERYSGVQIEIWRDRGESLCRRIYGGNFERLMNNVSAFSPTLQEWMLLEGYGRVLARPSLPIQLRELGIIAILTVKNQPRQLHSHLRGGIHVGLSASQLEAAVALCRDYTTKRNIASARRILSRVTAVRQDAGVRIGRKSQNKS